MSLERHSFCLLAVLALLGCDSAEDFAQKPPAHTFYKTIWRSGGTERALAAAMLRFLDPCTSLYQTDDDREGRRLASEPGFWPTANGQKDPLDKNPKARIMYNVFRVSDSSLDGCDLPGYWTMP